MAGFRESKPADGAEPEHAEEPRRRGLDELSGKGGSEEDFPEPADELTGSAISLICFGRSAASGVASARI